MQPGTVSLATPDTVGCTVLTWATPYASLTGGIATAGIPFWCRSSNGAWSVPQAVRQLSGNALRDAFTGTSWTDSVCTVRDGRWHAVQGYWAGGAPGHHGATTAGEVAYYFRLHPRPSAGRSWFGADTFFFAVGGQGWLRIDREVGGVVTPVQLGDTAGAVRLTEPDFLQQGLVLSTTLDFNATYHVYYVQERSDTWGGFVCKAVPGGRNATNAAGTAADALRAREAPVVSAGLFDDGDPPAAQQLTYVDNVEVQQQLGQTTTARFQLPLLNPQVHDGHGWEYYKASTQDPGELRLWDAGALTPTRVRRGRVVQVLGGYAGNNVVLFTGTVIDWDDAASGRVTVQCVGVEQRLMEHLDRNYPDPISYMTANYRQLSGLTGEPVYGIPAFDAWPLELALTECAQRGGLDASVLRTPLTVPTSTNLHTPVRDAAGTAVRRFRARALNGEYVRLTRPVHYGNAGVAYRPEQRPDDAYAFRPEPSQPVWQRMRSVAERYGYDLFSDAEGALLLRSRYNPYLAYGATAVPGYTLATNPAAYAGRYVTTSGTNVYTQPVRGARIDGVFALGPGVRRTWSVRVRDAAGTSIFGPAQLVLPDVPEPVWYYDARYTTDTTNVAVVTLWSGDYGDYTLELTPVVAGGGSEHRLNAVFTYAQDPDRPVLPEPLSTQIAAESVQVRSNVADQRNQVVVVGRRKAALTDSEKQAQNPENPEGEFVVESAVDVASITDPTSTTYLGYTRESLIYDSSITDQDYAAWVARTFIYRYNQPLPTVSVEHTLLPTLRLREAVFVDDTRFGTVRPDRPFYVTGYTHRWSVQGARTNVTCTGYPEYPSYEPRVDIDIDALFQGSPIANLQWSYRSLDGQLRVNQGPPQTTVREHTDAIGPTGDIVELVLPIQNGPTRYVDIPAGAPWPPVPGTLRFSTSGATTPPDRVVESEDDLWVLPSDGVTLRLPEIAAGGLVSVQVIPWERTGVGATMVPGEGFPIGVDPREVDYYYAVNYAAESITVYRTTFSGLLQPRQRISLRITFRPRDAGASLTWLTNNPYHHFFDIDYANRRVYFPWEEANGTAPHRFPTAAQVFTLQYRRVTPVSGGYPNGSPFYDPYTSELGHLVTARFDTLLSGQYRVSVRAASHDSMRDTVVAWLTESTADVDDPEAHWTYFDAGTQTELRWDGVDQVGRWNEYQSELIGAELRGVFEDGRDEVIGKGYYVQNRERAESGFGPLALIDATQVDAYGKPVFGVGPYAVFYLTIEARNGWTEARAVAGGLPAIRAVHSTQLPAALHNGSTSAYCYTHLPAPTAVDVQPSMFIGTYDDGALTQTGTWSSTLQSDTISNTAPIRLSFTVKQRPGVLWATQRDRVTVKVVRHAHLRAHVFDQFLTWDGSTYPESTTPQRTVVSRRLTNDDHTWTFVDSTWRTAHAIERNPWVFLPKHCRKVFAGREEALEFGNYLQLEEVPRWETSRQIAGSRSRLQLAFLNYLFYLSAYSQDRSGRRLWMVNPTFVDQSKITQHDPGTYVHPYRLTHGDPPYLFQRRSIFTRQWKEAWNGGASDIGYGTSGLVTQLCNGFPWDAWNTTGPDYWSGQGLEQDPTGAVTGPGRTLPYAGLGSWTWGTEPFWVPNPARDFHAYRLMPPMGDVPNNTGFASQEVENQLTHVQSSKLDMWQSTNADAAAFNVWSAEARDMNAGTPYLGPGGYKVGWRDAKKFPIGPHALDVLHQDELIHYEDIRGSWSRGPKPAEGVRYTAPSSPYFINVFRYAGIVQGSAQGTQGAQPLWRMAVNNWWRVDFRMEYVWEAPTWFPVTAAGGEALHGFNPYLVRVNAIDAAALRLDGGAWAGWKDDLLGGPTAFQYQWEATQASIPSGQAERYRNKSETGITRVFTCPWTPVALCGTLSTTRGCTFHLVLVPERR